MFNKNNLKHILTIISYLLRSLSVNLWLPIVIINVVIPLYCILLSNSSKNNIEIIIQFIIPVISIWWVILIHRFFLEEDGSELLSTFNINELVLLSMVFCITLIDYLITITFSQILIMKSFFIVSYRIVFVCFFYFGISYLVAVLSKTSIASLLTIIIYTLLNIFISRSKIDIFILYYPIDVSTSIMKNEFLLFCLSLSMLAVGYTISSKHVL